MKKGDEILYKETKRIDKICECCGHDDYDLVEREVVGIIEDTKLEFVHTLNNGFMTTDEVTEKDGKLVHRPCLTEPQLTEKEMIYKINGSWMTKEAIVKLI